MATGDRGGVTLPPPTPVAAPAPGRSPAGPASPASQPKPSGPLELPHPVLQAAGFHGGIQQFNQKVQQIVEAHQHAYGETPSPGLTLDVARSDVPSPGQTQPSDTQADVFATQPYQPPPGSGMNSTNPFVAELWNRIAAQPGASADTQLLASNAQLTGG